MTTFGIEDFEVTAPPMLAHFTLDVLVPQLRVHPFGGNVILPQVLVLPSALVFISLRRRSSADGDTQGFEAEGLLRCDAWEEVHS